MTQPQNFNLYLMDGTAQGRIRCTNKNWSGVALKIPQNKIENCGEVEELKCAGIYFLFSEDMIYIGAGTFQKIEKYWKDAVIFVNPNSPFDLNGLNFLKNKFCMLIANANSYKIKNIYENSYKPINDEKASDLEFFAGYIETILYLFGYKIFDSLQIQKSENKESKESILFYIKKKVDGKLIVAMCKKSNDEFIVLAGSQIVPKLSANVGKNIKYERQRAQISEDNILLEDVALMTSSTAARFVMGKIVNGRDYWRTKDGTSLGEILDGQPYEE